MNTMEFEEMQRIWDIQNQQPLYAINKEALHRRIESKKKQARKITNVTELLSIVAYTGSGGFALIVNLNKESASIFMYLMSAWMFVVVMYVLFCRMQRMNANKRFDRSMLGDLHHALSVATYQVRLSQLMRWSVIPAGVFVLLSFWEGGKSIWSITGALIFFTVTYYLSGWEHRWYEGKKQELQQLQQKLKS